MYRFREDRARAKIYRGYRTSVDWRSQLRNSDLPQLSRWLEAPHVKHWWRQPGDAAAVEAAYSPAIDGADPTELLHRRARRSTGRHAPALPARGQPRLSSGALEPAGAPRPAAGLDYLIGDPDLTGRGFGPSMIAEGSVGAWLAYPDVVAIVVTVQIENRRSWRALEKAGS